MFYHIPVYASNSVDNIASSIMIFTCFISFVSCKKIQHIAASKGSENCVLLLLDYEADPNSRGTFSFFFWLNLLNLSVGWDQLLLNQVDIVLILISRWLFPNYHFNIVFFLTLFGHSF